jgi:hypothetical protein
MSGTIRPPGVPGICGSLVMRYSRPVHSISKRDSVHKETTRAGVAPFPGVNVRNPWNLTVRLHIDLCRASAMRCCRPRSS